MKMINNNKAANLQSKDMLSSNLVENMPPFVLNSFLKEPTSRSWLAFSYFELLLNRWERLIFY